jgi:HPt (histidine-containing phosphotransfer) domain-containing protein
VNSTELQSNPGPLIDTDQLKAACDGDADLMRELMAMYFGQADQIIVGLQKAVQTGSVKEVDHLAHKLAGSSLACGLSAIVPSLRKMEQDAKAGHLNGAEALMAEAIAALELLRKAVQNYVSQYQAHNVTG